MRNEPEERRFQLLRGGSLQSHDTNGGSLIYVFFGVVWGLMRLMTGRKRIVLSLEGWDVVV